MLNYAHAVSLKKLLADNYEPGNLRRGCLSYNEAAAVEAAIEASALMSAPNALVDMAARAANEAQFERMCAERDRMRAKLAEAGEVVRELGQEVV